MNTTFAGNVIQIIIESSDIGNSNVLTLPDGYSVKQLYYSGSSNISLTAKGIYLSPNINITFPVVNSKSPSVFNIFANQNSKVGDTIRLTILEFGCIPDSHYFDKTFDPILIKSKDENGDEIEYNMIPSTQFER